MSRHQPLTAVQWWARAREQHRADPPARQWRDVVAYTELSRADQVRIEKRIKTGLASEDPNVRALAFRIAEDIATAELDTEPTSEHVRFEVTTAAWIGRPLDPGAPVPGCSCAKCIPNIKRDRPENGGTLVSHDPEISRLGRSSAVTSRRKARNRPNTPLNIDAARSIPITEVAHRLGLELHGRKREYARCPFHGDTHPSLHLNAKKRKAFCNPCGKSWDGIALVMDHNRIDFAAAVRWLLNLPEPERRSA